MDWTFVSQEKVEANRKVL
jgi:[histone H3]-lysine27 N-trimethyltransferase EZH2